MVCEVKLIVAGQIFTETVHARDYQDAKRTAIAVSYTHLTLPTTVAV